ncbi:MAG: hypothetical protein K2N51_12300 [Lachnospiraceae bacterium]|nr:hypothetical protein [Lachnospiraceae bacterium]
MVEKIRQRYSNNNQQVASQSNMQQQIEKGQAPNEIDRVDKTHVNGQNLMFTLKMELL